jgi:protein phosphatase
MDTTEDIPRFSYVSCAALTDVGRKRKNNEDNYGTFPDAGVFCVADGMGGARDGEVASRIVVEHLAGALRNWEKISPPIPIEDRLALVDKCLDAASLWINQYAASHDAAGCGTTFVGVVFDPGKPGHAVAVHAGDSRLYRIHRHKITQITCDHSVANMTGVKNENELNPVFRNMILRAVGIKPAVELERTSFEVASGDWVLICSDGLTKMIDDKAIAKIVTAAEGGKAAVHTLVAEANRCGGRDNVTVILLHVGDLPPALPVHARLTEAEFLACMGVAASETSTTTETAFTMPTGTSGTDQSALTAVPLEEGAASAGWLSDDDDADNTPVPVGGDDAGDEGEDEGMGKREEGSQPSGRDAPVAPAPDDSSDDTKTTEDIPPPPDADTKTTEDIPPPPDADTKTTEDIPVPPAEASSRTTEEMAPRQTVVGKRKAFPLILLAVALLAAVAVAVTGLKRSRQSRENALLAEKERLAAIAREAAIAEMNFSARATAALSPLQNLDNAIKTSSDPESYANTLVAAKASLDEAWAAAKTHGVTNESFYESKRVTYASLSNKVATAIAKRREELNRTTRTFAADAANAIEANLSGKVLAEIEGSSDPESFRANISVAENAIRAAWDKAVEAGVTNEAVWAAAFGDYSQATNDFTMAITKRLNKLQGDLADAEKKFGDAVETALQPFANIVDKIKTSDNPDSHTNALAKARDGIETAWKSAQDAGVPQSRHVAAINQYETIADNVRQAIRDRRAWLDAEREYRHHDATCTSLCARAIADAASYRKTLKDIDAAIKALPAVETSSPWKAKYDDLRAKYGKLKEGISASTAKIEVKNDGEVALSVTLGGKTETIAPAKPHPFDNLDVWKSYDISAVVAPGRDMPTALPDDYTLDHDKQSASTKGPKAAAVSISFKAVYKGDPKLVVENNNAVAIKVNGDEIKAGETKEITGKPRTTIPLKYACDEADYKFEDGAMKPVDVTLGNAGTMVNRVAAKLVKKPKVEDLTSGGDAPAAHPQEAPTSRPLSAAADDKEKGDATLREQKAKLLATIETHGDKMEKAYYQDYVRQNFFSSFYLAINCIQADISPIIQKSHHNDKDMKEAYEVFKKAVRAFYNPKTGKMIDKHGSPEQHRQWEEWKKEIDGNPKLKALLEDSE